MRRNLAGLIKQSGLPFSPNQIPQHGGKLGMRDQGLLDFVLARAPHRRRCDPDADILSLAASYGFGLANNHPFIDGNKRVAFMAMYIFLELNGYHLIATEPEVVTLMLDVAVGALDEAGLEAWLRSHAQPL
ncbi:MAG TPA: type II toxin-antitoxin system death-on-curing family toxin [Candidatus Latescibacteria bacterium]|nr:type II toxin-antitoxin system death-on-curing family toxin [Candidatus Latescibacterota bacterium]